ncbi:MAG: hypothetical protein QXE06_07825 [Candidatus Bathyarchaeia archaeon]
MSKTKDVEYTAPKVRLSLILYGDTAKILLELRARGVVRSFADAINQGIRLLYDRIIEQDIRCARLKALQESLEDEKFV